jgi:hypothetical protein
MSHDRRKQQKLFRQILDVIGLAGVDSFRRALSDFRRSTVESASRENWIGKVHMAFSNTPLCLGAVPIPGHMTRTKKLLKLDATADEHQLNRKRTGQGRPERPRSPPLSTVRGRSIRRLATVSSLLHSPTSQDRGSPGVILSCHVYSCGFIVDDLL